MARKHETTRGRASSSLSTASEAGGASYDEGADLQAWWPETWAQQQVTLPAWESAGELPEHQKAILHFRTEPCEDYFNGYCSQHRPRGRASLCFRFHFDNQRRRAPVDEVTGQLLYWDQHCPDGDKCANGSCVFAHNAEEISYHPGKYKTKRCNGRGCRGESICCFAHTEAEMRSWAPRLYAYPWQSSGPGRGTVRPGCDVAGAPAMFDADEEWKRHPTPARHKQRFCASYPDVSQCRRGASCTFAHSREEAQTRLLTPEQEQQAPSALTDAFFMYEFKTLWCPIGVQHDWQTCVYAHNYQDARRKVSIGYGPRPCPYWAKKDPSAEYSQRCPLGLRCPYSHGAKEQLYHPNYFRTVVCRDLRAKACPRQQLCAFFHRRAERRQPPVDKTDYSVPLKEDALPETWVTEFLQPPFRDTGASDPAEGGTDKLVDFWCSDPYGLGAEGGFMMDHTLHELPVMANLEADKVYSDFLRSSLAQKGLYVDNDGNGTPRTQTEGSDPADDLSSWPSRDALGQKAAAGPLDDSPWKVETPSYASLGSFGAFGGLSGPFGGPFTAFPGFLAGPWAESAAHLSSGALGRRPDL